jgi:non-ribosomal peptide synthetase component F
LYITLLTAYKVLLHGYTNLSDILVTSPIANRHSLEAEPLIGFFANTIVLRTDLSGKPTGRDLLRRVTDVALNAYAHQALPFEKLVESLSLEHDLSADPLGRVSFALLSMPRQSITDAQQLRLNVEPVELEAVDVDLGLKMWETPEGLSGRLVYDAALFTPDSITHLTQNFQRVLRSLVDDPERSLSELALDLELKAIGQV